MDVRGVAQPTDAELEIGDGDPFVGRVDERRGDFRRHLAARWEEAVRDCAERVTQPVAVGEPRALSGSDLRAGNRLADEALERAPERRVERRSRPAARLDPLEVVLDVRAEHRADHRLDVLGVLAGQEPAVDLDLARPRE